MKDETRIVISPVRKTELSDLLKQPEQRPILYKLLALENICRREKLPGPR